MKRLLPIALCLILLTGCAGAKISQQQSTVKAINKLVSNFQIRHPDLVNWDKNALSLQLNSALPIGIATEAGWKIVWPSAKVGQLPQIIVPWSQLSIQPPEKLKSETNYSGGVATAEINAAQIREHVIDQVLHGDALSAAVTDLRTSIADSNWVIFTVTPYLPFTDQAYGFAHLTNGRWQIVDFGTATVGCGIVPTKVQIEFGFTCPPGS